MKSNTPLCHCRVESKRGRIRYVRALFVFICSLELVCPVRGEKGQKNTATHAKTPQPATNSQRPAHNKPNVQRATTQSQHPTPNNANLRGAGPQSQHSAINNIQQSRGPHNVVAPGGNVGGASVGGHAAQMRQSGHPPPQQGHLQPATAVRPAAPTLTKEQQQEVHAQSEGFRNAEQYRQWRETGRVEAPAISGVLSNQHRTRSPDSGVYRSPRTPATFTQRHYDLPKTLVPDKEKVTFQSGRHIPGCHNWKDSKCGVFRNYTPEWHDKNWWITHHRRIVLVCGGWYYWNAGYWFPAWGYHSDAVYAYDGPIYAYHDLLPDQVIANVQAALQELGYYNGPIDGVLGLAMRDAIANYQRDHGLYTTSAIDEPTLEALGMT